jgi:hypothetical protein
MTFWTRIRLPRPRRRVGEGPTCNAVGCREAVPGPLLAGRDAELLTVRKTHGLVLSANIPEYSSIASRVRIDLYGAWSQEKRITRHCASQAR